MAYHSPSFASNPPKLPSNPNHKNVGHPNKLRECAGAGAGAAVRDAESAKSEGEGGVGEKKKKLSLTDLRESVPVLVLVPLCMMQRVQRVTARAGLEKRKKKKKLSLTDLRESVSVLLYVKQKVQRVSARARAGLEKRRKKPQLDRSEGECTGVDVGAAVREVESEGEGELGKKKKTSA